MRQALFALLALALLTPTARAADNFVTDSIDTSKFLNRAGLPETMRAAVDLRSAVRVLQAGVVTTAQSAPSFTGTAASGSNGLACQQNGCRVDFGAGTSDYASSNGTTVTFAGLVAASNLSGTNTGDVTLTAVGSSPSANGASLSSQALTLQPADTTHPGVMTTGSQSIAGAKTLTGATTLSGGVTATTPQPASVATSGTAATDVVTGTGGKGGNTTGVTGQTAGNGSNVALTAGAGGNAPSGSTNGDGGSITLTAGAAGAGAGTAGTAGKINLAGDVAGTTATFIGAIGASNLSGSSSGANTGDVTLAAVGSTPSANGASLSSQALTLQPADATHPGVVTAIAQTFAGVKTFAGIVPGTTSLSTCGSTIAEFTLSQQGGGVGGTRSKICFCTSDGGGTPSYAWKNVTDYFADQASSIGTATTCP
jgi:hypothetical protein